MPTLDIELELRAQFLQALAGDETAYRLFLQRLAGHLRAWLGRRLFGWPDDVEDLVLGATTCERARSLSCRRNAG